MKKKFLKGFLWFLVGFAVFFGLRVVYGYIVYPDGNAASTDYDDDNFRFSVRNFASYGKSDFDAKGSFDVKSSPAPAADAPVPDAMQSGEMKYEKVGVVRSRTDGYDRDEKNTRNLIKQYGVLVQFEQSSGLKGRRVLHLGLGVVPERFDEVVAQLRTIGRLRSIRIDKTDKTNEYRELGAKRVSLEKTRDALVALKSKGGSVEESISLEERIFEIEENLQSLGVKLGEFDTENEFCTVKFSLSESASFSIPVSTRMKIAFEWTVKFYLGFMVVLVLGALVVLIIVVILEKLKWIPSAAKASWRAQNPPPQS